MASETGSVRCGCFLLLLAGGLFLKRTHNLFSVRDTAPVLVQRRGRLGLRIALPQEFLVSLQILLLCVLWQILVVRLVGKGNAVIFIGIYLFCSA